MAARKVTGGAGSGLGASNPAGGGAPAASTAERRPSGGAGRPGGSSEQGAAMLPGRGPAASIAERRMCGGAAIGAGGTPLPSISCAPGFIGRSDQADIVGWERSPSKSVAFCFSSECDVTAVVAKARSRASRPGKMTQELMNLTTAVTSQ